MLRFRCDHVANTLSVTTNRDRASPLLAGSPTEQRLTALHSRSPPQRIYGLLQTRPHGSFAAQPAALKPPGQFRAAPLPHRCRVPSVRAPGQDFHLRSQHPYSAHSLGPDGPPLTADPLRLHGNERPLTRTSATPSKQGAPMHSVDSNIPTLPASATWMHNREQGPPPVEDPGPAASRRRPGPARCARQ
jgi:hypothetical protein